MNDRPPSKPATDPRQRAVAILKTRSAFAGCPDTVIDELVRRARHVKLAKGATAFRQGEPGDSLMIVLSGSLKVTATTDAKEVVLGFVKAGALIGEIAALDGGERTATVTALEPVEAMAIFRRDLVPVLRSNEDSMMGLLVELCARLRATNALLESYALDTDARVASGLVRLAEEHGRMKGGVTTIDLKVSQRDLGNHLGLTRETISRTLSSFREKGLIEIRDAAIVVHDLDALRGVGLGEGDDTDEVPPKGRGP